MRKHLLQILLFLAISPACAHNSLPVANHLDMKAYMGKWYEIARLPNSFEEKCKGNVNAEYTLLDNRDVRVINSCDTHEGKRSSAEGLAWQPNPKVPTKLLVSFVPFLKNFHLFGGDYWIFDVDESSYALVGSPDHKYLWILSRTPEMSLDDMGRLLEKAKHLGFETKYLIFTQHT